MATDSNKEARSSIAEALGIAISNAVKKYSSQKSNSGTSSSSASKGSNGKTSYNKSKNSVSSSSGGYKNPYPDRETQYRWSDGSISYSNAENYITAAREAGKDLNKTTLLGSTSYNKNYNPLKITNNSSGAYKENDRINLLVNEIGKPYKNNYRYKNDTSYLFDRIQGSDKYKLKNLQIAWNSTDNKDLKNLYHNEAEKLRKAYGIGSDGYGGTLMDLGYSGDLNDYANRDDEYRRIDYEKRINQMYDEIIDDLERESRINKRNNLRELENMKSNVNREYDRLANEAYINTRVEQNLLPQILSARGINGGAEESSNIKLMTNHQNNLNKNETERISELLDLENYIQDLIMKGEQEKAQTLSNIKKERISDLIRYYEKENELNLSEYKYQNEKEEGDREKADKWLSDITSGILDKQQKAAEFASKLGDYSYMGELLGVSENLTKKATEDYAEQKRLEIIRKRALANRR